MPRKQNGWGEKRVQGVKKFDGNPRVKKAAGSYPSNRQYGSRITRTVIEDWNSKSPWVRWRKGMEYYYQAAYVDFQETTAVLFQGTESEIDISFDGYRFATKNADSRTHYAIRRRMDQNRDIGDIQEIHNNAYSYPTNKLNHEIWLKVDVSQGSDTLLLRSAGERVTDGLAAANIKTVLTSTQEPATYLGKSLKTGVQIETSIPLSEIQATSFVQENGGTQALIGQVVYMPEFYNLEMLTAQDVFTDGTEYFNVEMDQLAPGKEVVILKNDTRLPPTLGDIEDLVPIYSSTTTSTELVGGFYFRKSDYQRFFGNQYLTADLVRSKVDRASFAIMPQRIFSVRENAATNELFILTEPFQSTLRLFTPTETERYVILDDRGFTKQYPDYDADGQYLHAPIVPGETEWQTLELEIDPWMDQTFVVGNTLTFADLYTCSCPDYLHAIIRSPETYDSERRTLNRQQRAPLPTASGISSYDDAGTLKVAGIASSWANDDYNKSFKICKHSIASMFINKIRVQEPSQVPSSESREQFEPKLKADISEVGQEFTDMLKRSEVTTVEIVFALASALNLDDVEIGYVLQTASF